MSTTIAKPQETASPQNEEIRIELIEEKDSVAVLDMLKKFFFKVLYSILNHLILALKMHSHF